MYTQSLHKLAVDTAHQYYVSSLTSFVCILHTLLFFLGFVKIIIILKLIIIYSNTMYTWKSVAMLLYIELEPYIAVYGPWPVLYIWQGHALCCDHVISSSFL